MTTRGTGSGKPSRLLKLKDWLTVPEAARSLSLAIGEDVTEADIFRLALDGHLTLSVNFVNKTYGRVGRAEPAANFEPFSTDATDDSQVVPRRVALWPRAERTYEQRPGQFGVVINEREVVPLNDETSTIEGFWDLPMIGCERLDVEHEYHRLTGGPEVRDRSELDLTLVRRSDGSWGQLLMSNESLPSSNQPDPVSLGLKRPFPDSATTNDFEEAEILGEIPRGVNCLAPGLPKDSVFVVRTAALMACGAKLSTSEPNEMEKPLDSRERTTLLVIMAALARGAGIDLAQPSKAAMQIEALTTELEARVAGRTIEEHLKRIPDALERRGKTSD